MISRRLSFANALMTCVDSSFDWLALGDVDLVNDGALPYRQMAKTYDVGWTEILASRGFATAMYRGVSSTIDRSSLPALK